MVKPSKSMQPEAVNMAEINKKGTRGMGGDDFRNYMARKINLQREQFGVVLPPPPPEDEPRKVHFAESVNVPITKKRKIKDMPSLLKRLKKRHASKKSRKRVREANGQQQQQQSHSSEDPEVSVAKMPQHIDVEAGSVGEFQHEAVSQSDRFAQSLMKRVSDQKPSPSQKRHRPDLFFRGVVVLVNGYTDPDTDTLMRTLHKHGGDLEKYETSRVTHIIAQNLSTAKANMYKRQRQPRPVCRPEWIVESVKAGRLLPHGQFLIQEVQPKATNSVKKFFVKTKDGDDNRKAAEESVDGDNISRGMSIVAQGATMSGMIDAGCIVYSPAKKSSATNVAENEDVTNSRQDAENDKESSAPSLVSNGDPDLLLTSRGHAQSETGTEVMCNKSANERATADDANGCKETEPLVDTVGNATTLYEQNQTTEKPRSGDSADEELILPHASGVAFADGRTRTVGTDPNFLESYFNSSRLSFIGSFKQRARQSPTKRAAKRPKTAKRYVFLVDMDSFFASVVLRNFPEYRDKPVAISHMGKQVKKGTNVDRTQLGTKDSTSECATCNYKARKYGIKKGMFLGTARELCPDLVVLDYDFEGYEEVSEQVADILFRVADLHNGTVEQVSCDESYMELFLSGDEDMASPDEKALAIAESIRKEVYEVTQCTATVGIASNKLLAKLAADQVKPNRSMVVDDHRTLLESLKLRDLHGIGYRMEEKLAEENLVCVRDIWELGDHGESELIRILGPGLGKKISLFCQGKDDRPVKPVERKTISAECNYGIRFDGPYGVDHLVEGLAKEVTKRMNNVGIKGSRVTLKVKQRKQGAKPPPKFLGHGSCHNLSKSAETSGGIPTKDTNVISHIALNLLKQLNVPTDDIRGMGIVVSKLVDENAVKGGDMDFLAQITSWFRQSTAKAIESDSRSSSHRPLMEPFDSVGDNSGSQAIDQMNTLDSPLADETFAEPLLSQKNGKDDVVSPPRMRDEHEHHFKCFGDSTDGPGMRSSAIAEGHISQDIDDDIALPSFSQLHMSQVAELPSPMRKSIVARISALSETSDSNRREPTTITSNTVVKPRVAGRRPKNDHAKEGAVMKQLSVKRMFKLAAIKSGQDETLSDTLGGSVSLTQLECLPLEMQLQVANNDEIFFGHRSPSSTRKKRHQLREAGTIMGHHDKASRPKDTNGSQKECRGEENEPVVRYRAPLISEQPSFYQENIAPLMHFMDANLEAEGEAVQTVLELLHICVGEHRFSDAVKLLRSIKNRDDTWSGNAYQEILASVNEQTQAALGKPLDLKGLGL